MDSFDFEDIDFSSNDLDLSDLGWGLFVLYEYMESAHEYEQNNEPLPFCSLNETDLICLLNEVAKHFKIEKELASHINFNARIAANMNARLSAK